MIDAAGVARRRTRVAVSALLALILVLVGIAIVSAQRLYPTAEDRYIRQAVPIRITARDLTLQMVNEETAVRAKAAGLMVVMNKCIGTTHAALKIPPKG